MDTQPLHQPLAKLDGSVNTIMTKAPSVRSTVNGRNSCIDPEAFLRDPLLYESVSGYDIP